MNKYAPPRSSLFMLEGYELQDTLKILRNWDELTNEECEDFGVPLRSSEDDK